MQTAITLSKLGISPVIIEREETIGGKLNRWDRLFPTMTPASEVLGSLREQVDASGAEILTSREVKEIGQEGKNVTLNDGTRLRSDAVVVTSGFDLFPAELKEEYGYKIYDNVYTTVDVERMFRNGGIRTADGRIPKTIAFLHCVGSRDEKVNQRHCSRVCCITGVKQAIEMKQAIPDAEVYSFYMDMRTLPAGAAGVQYPFHPRPHLRGEPNDRQPSADQGRRHADRPAAENDRRHAGADRRHESRSMQPAVEPLQRRRPIPQRIRQAERSVYRKRRLGVAAYLLCRNDHGAEKHRGVDQRSRRRRTPGGRIAKRITP